MEGVFIELQKLIDYLQSAYTEVTNEWMCRPTAKVNMKKTLVADIDADGAIYQSIMEYLQLLNEKNTDIILHLSEVCTCAVSARVKAPNSVEYKIQSYKTERHGSGKVPINKCINDLFGARIFLEVPLSFEDVYGFVEENYSSKYRSIDSSKQDYKAVHIYFKENNQSFPWELQIWNLCDAETNFASHKNYKQGYTTWEQESKKGGIIDG